jgi:hypothetical protein
MIAQTIDKSVLAWYESLPEATRNAFIGEVITSPFFSQQSNQSYRDNPAGYSKDILGIDLWEKQKEVLDSVRLNTRTVVESGHGVGKSVAAAVAACWWMDTQEGDNVKCLTLAPTHNQVQNILWRYIRNYGRKAGLPGEILDTPRWEFGRDQPERFAIGISPKKSSEADMASAQGYHSPKLLVIMDECAGLPRLMWEAVNNLQPTRILAIGNPIEQVGAFWEARNSQIWQAIHISCLEHPNVVQGKETSIPGAVSRQWVQDMIVEHAATCIEETAGSFFFQGQWLVPDTIFESRVLGRAPAHATDQLISLAWIDAARNRELVAEGETVISLDPARQGGDDFAIIVRTGSKIRYMEARQATSNNPTAEVVGWFLGKAAEYDCQVGFIDEGGMGGPILDVARQQGALRVIGVNAASRSPKKNQFLNMRAYCWWQMREQFQQGLVDLPSERTRNGDKLESDLITPKYSFDQAGKIKLESKDEIKKRLGRSPDLGDALANSYALPAKQGLEQKQVGNQRSRWADVGGQHEGGSRWRG